MMNFNNINLKIIFTLFLFMTLVSCSTVQIGNDFELKAFAINAEPGTSKKEQVLKWLGKPTSTGIAQKEDGERLDEWNYFFGTGQLPSMKDVQLKTLQIRFDKNGVLRSYNWSSSN